MTLLLDHQADPNFNCQHGWTPLHAAAVATSRYYEKVTVLEVLLKNGADLEIENVHYPTPIVCAAEN